MRNWQEKQYQKQLDHYTPKRLFNYVVDLDLPAEYITINNHPAIFIQGSRSNGGRATYLWNNWPITIENPHWRPTGEMTEWLAENIKHGYYMVKDRGVLAFTKPEDAIAFKLMWS